MARYEDYAKDRDESIEDEIENAAEKSAERATSNIPESVLNRFADKSTDEILESYANLERRFSEQGNKMGDLRKSFDEYVLLQSQPSEPEPAPEPVSDDDLYDNPEEAIARVVERKTEDKIEKLEQKLAEAQRQRALSDFEAKHPGYQETAESAEFLEWVKASPYRVRLAQAADAYDLDAADELFGLYEDLTSAQESQRTARRDADLRNAQLESSSPDSPELDQMWSRSEIIERKLLAKQGDRESQNWLSKNAEEIAIAYEEGRVVD